MCHIKFYRCTYVGNLVGQCSQLYDRAYENLKAGRGAKLVFEKIIYVIRVRRLNLHSNSRAVSGGHTRGPQRVKMK